MSEDDLPPDSLAGQMEALRRALRDLGRVLWDEREVFVVLYVALAFCLIAWLVLA